MKSYPPLLDQILERCPKAAYLYTILWRGKEDDNTISYDKKTVNNELTLTWRNFKHNLMLLKKEKAIKITFSSNNEKVKISFNMPQQDNEKAA